MKYNSKSNVVFGGISFADYNAFSIGCNIYEQPSRDVSTVAVPGRNGVLTFDNGRYNNCSRTYRVYANGTDDAKNLLAALSRCTGYNRLEDEYDPELYMLAYMSRVPNLDNWVGEGALFTISFDRKPQKFLKSGEKAITFTANGQIRNDTLFEARPLVRVYGTGTVSIGSNSIQILQSSTYVDIDCEVQNAYKGGTNCNSDIRLLSGDFFSLANGNNGVQISSGVSSIEVTPRWWTL